MMRPNSSGKMKDDDRNEPFSDDLLGQMMIPRDSKKEKEKKKTLITSEPIELESHC